jgi:hypothetical protein
VRELGNHYEAFFARRYKNLGASLKKIMRHAPTMLAAVDSLGTAAPRRLETSSTAVKKMLLIHLNAPNTLVVQIWVSKASVAQLPMVYYLSAAHLT